MHGTNDSHKFSDFVCAHKGNCEWRLIRSRRYLYANWASLRACERFEHLPLICRFIVRKLLHLPRWFSFKVLFNWTIKAYGPTAGNPIQGNVQLLRPRYFASHQLTPGSARGHEHCSIYGGPIVLICVCVWFSTRVIAGLSHFGPSVGKILKYFSFSLNNGIWYASKIQFVPSIAQRVETPSQPIARRIASKSHENLFRAPMKGNGYQRIHCGCSIELRLCAFNNGWMWGLMRDCQNNNHFLGKIEKHTKYWPFKLHRNW